MCELCTIQTKEKIYYVDESCIILDCETCHIPMIVSMKHTMIFSLGEIIHFIRCITEVFGGFVSLRMDQRKISDHFHAYIIMDRTDAGK